MTLPGGISGSAGQPAAGTRSDLGQPFRRQLLILAATLVMLGGLALAIDLPVATWCANGPLPKELMRLLNFSEVFAHGTGATALLCVVLAIDPGLRLPRPGRTPWGDPTVRGFLQIVAATFTGGLLADLVKASVARVRPRAIDFAQLASVWGTFGDAARLPHSGSHSDVTSFPSGHAAVAAGLAAALAWRYPRHTRLFAVLAVMAAAQRVASSAHYPSDVAYGAALGLVGAALWLDGCGAAVESPRSAR
jgi:membrane-associated phospholipid phosphatase